MPHGSSAKMSPKWPPGASPGPSGGLPGTPRRPEIDQLFAPGGPQAANNEFFGTPGPLQEGSGEPLEAESAPKGRPEASREPFWSHFASILDPPGHHFPRFPAAFSVVFLVFLIVFSPPPSALLFAFSVLQALRPQLGGRFWGASPCEIRPPSITEQLAVVSAAFAAVV